MSNAPDPRSAAAHSTHTAPARAVHRWATRASDACAPVFCCSPLSLMGGDDAHLWVYMCVCFVCDFFRGVCV